MASEKGTCSVCGRQITLNKNGRVRQHGSKEPGAWPPRNCAGWDLETRETLQRWQGLDADE